MFIDDNVVVVRYPTDAEILENLEKWDENEDNDVLFYDTPTTVPIAHQTSNKEMQRIYVCSKKSTSNEVYSALQILKNFVNNELFKVTQSKFTEFYKNK